MPNGRRCASRDSTNQNASFVERFSRSEGAVFRGICGEIFALFQPCVGNFDTTPPRKVVGTLYLDSSCVIFKYFAVLSVCDKFELFGHTQAAMMIWVLFSPFFLDSLLVTVRDFIGLFRSTCYFNLVTFPVMRRWKCLWMNRLSQPSSTSHWQVPENGLRNLPKRKPTWSE